MTPVREVSLPVTGMTCANCAATVERTLRKTEGVAEASVNFASERASVRFDPAEVREDRLVSRVTEAGFGVATQRFELPLVGMTCANCAATIERTLQEAGFAMSDVVRAQYTVTDAALVDGIFAVLGETFGEIRPAATMVIAGLIRPEMKVEIEVTAHRP